MGQIDLKAGAQTQDVPDICTPVHHAQLFKPLKFLALPNSCLNFTQKGSRIFIFWPFRRSKFGGLNMVDTVVSREQVWKLLFSLSFSRDITYIEF